MTSGGDGGYNLPSLPVGPYTIKVTANGFSTYNQSGIVIQVGNELRVDVKLQVGGVAQTVQVTSAASMVQTEDQSISQVVDRQRTVDLPLNGRQATQLILLTPGTSHAPADRPGLEQELSQRGNALGCRRPGHQRQLPDGCHRQ